MWRVMLGLALASLCIDLLADCTRAYRATALSAQLNDVSVPFLQRVMSEANCKLVILPLTSTHQRRLRMIEDGEIDVVAEASRLPERELYAWFSLPYREEKTILIGLQGNPQLEEIKSITDVARFHLHILSPDGGWFGVDLQRERDLWRTQKLIVSYKDPLEALKDLRLGRAQLLLLTDELYQMAFKKEKDIYVLPFVVHSEAVYLMFSKRTVSAEDVELINQALEKVKP